MRTLDRKYYRSFAVTENEELVGEIFADGNVLLIETPEDMPSFLAKAKGLNGGSNYVVIECGELRENELKRQLAVNRRIQNLKSRREFFAKSNKKNLTV